MAPRKTISKTPGHRKMASSKEKQQARLEGQYQVIKDDVLKLREDLAHGYDLIKKIVEKIIGE